MEIESTGTVYGAFGSDSLVVAAKLLVVAAKLLVNGIEPVSKTVIHPKAVSVSARARDR